MVQVGAYHLHWDNSIEYITLSEIPTKLFSLQLQLSSGLEMAPIISIVLWCFHGIPYLNMSLRLQYLEMESPRLFICCSGRYCDRRMRSPVRSTYVVYPLRKDLWWINRDITTFSNWHFPGILLLVIILTIISTTRTPFTEEKIAERIIRIWILSQM